MRNGIIIFLVLLTTGLPASVHAQETQPLQVTARNVTALEAERADPSGAVLPGDVVEYRLLFTNTTPDDVTDVVFSDPIPDGLTYVLGSAGAERASAVVEYSIDGGATWSARPEVVFQDGGRAVRRPAPAESYTHVRWTLEGAVSPGAQVAAQFRVQAPRPGRDGGAS